MAIIFHITKRESWDAAQAAGSYQAEMYPIDGFIHCSKRDQVVQVADARFRSQSDLVLLCIDTEKVAAEIVYENLEGGQELFPHIYGEINNDAVVQVAAFEPTETGYFTLPSSLGSE